MLPPDHEPDRVDGHVSLVEEPVRGGRVEGDRVAGTQHVRLEPDLDVQGAAHDVAVLAAVGPHPRLRGRGWAALERGDQAGRRAEPAGELALADPGLDAFLAETVADGVEERLTTLGRLRGVPHISIQPPS